MTMPYLSDTVICFDLDDTLYKERDFLKSAFGEIAERVGHPEANEQMVRWYQEGKNAFKELISLYDLNLTIADCLKIYRNHFPMISLEPGVKGFLKELKDSGAMLGLITDGRSTTQRNKISALGLDGLFDIVVISEEVGSVKPDYRNYKMVMDFFQERSVFVYIGDNPQKDFIAPNHLGWYTYCLKNDGRNIHRQDLNQAKEVLPQHIISQLKEFAL